MLCLASALLLVFLAGIIVGSDAQVLAIQVFRTAERANFGQQACSFFVDRLAIIVDILVIDINVPSTANVPYAHFSLLVCAAPIEQENRALHQQENRPSISKKTDLASARKQT
jgi:hypothetical protein